MENDASIPSEEVEWKRFNEKFDAADQVKAELYPLLLKAELFWGPCLPRMIEGFYKRIGQVSHLLFVRQLKLRRPYRNEKSWRKQWDEVEEIEKNEPLRFLRIDEWESYWENKYFCTTSWGGKLPL